LTEEKRANQRRRTLFKGYIVFNERRSTVECTIRNMSAAGAQLQVASVVGIPDTFDLIINDKESHKCVVARRLQGELGVAFVRPGYEGPLLSVNLAALHDGSYEWTVTLAAAGDDGAHQGYKAEGTVPTLETPLQPFEISVQDDKRPVWTPIPESQRPDIRETIKSLAADALARSAKANTAPPK
jgi:hypothetical protein